MHFFAQTNIQLFNQLAYNGYSKPDLDCILKAYKLAMRLFTGYFRGNGKSFIAHLVGTASILGSVNAPVEVVAAGLIHAAYLFGDFGDGGSGMSYCKQEEVRRAVSPEVEEYIARYHALQWNAKSILAIRENLNNLSPTERNIVLMRLANELEDHLDVGILYCANVEKRLQYINYSGHLMVEVAEKLGFPILATELSRVFKELTSSEIFKELRSEYDCSFLIPPQSHQKRLSLVIRHKLDRRLRAT